MECGDSVSLAPPAAPAPPAKRASVKWASEPAQATATITDYRQPLDKVAGGHRLRPEGDRTVLAVVADKYRFAARP